jgi:hypothetical protein
VRSLLAQFEHLAMKYNLKFLRRCSVSYFKQLLTPSAIWKFGWNDGLATDVRSKMFWGALSKEGGTSSAPEGKAVTGFIRSLALLDVVNNIR